MLVGGQSHRGSFSLWLAANLREKAETAEFERLLGLAATRRYDGRQGSGRPGSRWPTPEGNQFLFFAAVLSRKTPD